MTAMTVDRSGNVSPIGVALAGLFSRWTADKQVVVCLRSLGPMLDGTELRRVYQFLHVLTGQIQTSGAVGHYHRDPAYEESKLRPLTTLVDAVLERDEEGEWSIEQR